MPARADEKQKAARRTSGTAATIDGNIREFDKAMAITESANRGFKSDLEERLHKWLHVAKLDRESWS